MSRTVSRPKIRSECLHRVLTLEKGDHTVYTSLPQRSSSSFPIVNDLVLTKPQRGHHANRGRCKQVWGGGGWGGGTAPFYIGSLEKLSSQVVQGAVS